MDVIYTVAVDHSYVSLSICCYQDDKFLSVLYPNYITWLLQPLKYTSFDDEAELFALHDSIVELLTFCTEAHGYRVKYLFGRQPIASYIDQMLRSKNRLSVIRECCLANGLLCSVARSSYV